MMKGKSIISLCNNYKWKYFDDFKECFKSTYQSTKQLYKILRKALIKVFIINTAEQAADIEN